MRKNYILALLLFLMVIIVTYFASFRTSIGGIKEVVSDTSCDVKQISKEEDKYIVKAYKPVSNIAEFDEKIDAEYKNIIMEFEKNVENLNLQGDGKKFSLDINFNSYEYNEYISFLISYLYDLGGAHPDSGILTINYNKRDKSFVNIDTLISKDKNILDVFSKYSYESLKQNNEGLEDGDILREGTLAKKDNFKNFVLSKEGIILFFPNYSVASYYLGSFEVVIPYQTLGILYNEK